MSSVDNLDEAKRIEAAGQRAVRDAMRVHKALGQSVVVWKDGKVVEIPATEIDVPSVENDPLPDPR